MQHATDRRLRAARSSAPHRHERRQLGPEADGLPLQHDVQPGADAVQAEDQRLRLVALALVGVLGAAQLADTVAGHPEVLACCTVTGDADALLHLAGAHTAHLARVLDKIRDHPDVEPMRTRIVPGELFDQPPP